MINEFKVITLCGSTRFKDAFLKEQKRLTLEGNIVVSVGLFGHSGDEEVWKPGIKEMLDRMHLSKIDMADEIFVINVDGYVGESTKKEIEYAKSKGKAVNYLEPNHDAILDNSISCSESEYWPTIEDYLASIKEPYESFSKLKRFRPYILPDGSYDFWYDSNKVVFRMIDSLQENYQFGMECALNKDYCNSIVNEVQTQTSDDQQLYERELTVSCPNGKLMQLPVILHRNYVVEKRAKKRTMMPITDKEHYFELSKDKKTLLSWNETNGLIGKSFSVAYIPEGVEIISDGAFSGCNNLERLVLPESLKIIGNWAFSDCGSFTIHFKGNQLEKVGEYAFNGCFLKPEKGIISLVETIKDVDPHAFANSMVRFNNKDFELNSIRDGNKMKICLNDYVFDKYDGLGSDLDYDDLFETSIEDEFGVVYDKNYKFILACNNKNIQKYKLKESTIGISKFAFFSVKQLKEIDLSNVKFIGEKAFSGCEKLELIRGGQNIEIIGPEAFSYTSLKIVILPKTLKKLCYGAFMYCKFLEKVTDNSTIHEIAGGSFQNCEALYSVKLNNEVRIIERMAFSKCNSLTGITLPSKIRKLGELCFLKCPFTEIILPKSLVSMDYSPFCNCLHLKVISRSPFFYATKQFLLGYNKTRLISYFLDEKNIVIPGTVKVILGYSLSNKTKAKKIYLPDSVECIGHWAFRYAKAEILNFPKSIRFVKSSFDYNGGIDKYQVCSTQRKLLSGAKSFGTTIEEY